MPARTERIELRTDRDSKVRIAQAAEAVKQPVSAFVLAAATSEADRVLARTHLVVMHVEQLDDLVASPDTPDSAPNLERAATRKRRFAQR